MQVLMVELERSQTERSLVPDPQPQGTHAIVGVGEKPVRFLIDTGVEVSMVTQPVVPTTK